MATLPTYPGQSTLTPNTAFPDMKPSTISTPSSYTSPCGTFWAVSFDEEFGIVVGIPTGHLYLIFLCLIALTVVILIRVVSIILVIALLTIPAAMARQARTASWHVNALVDATPISGPASVGRTRFDSRAMVDSRTFTIEAIC